MTAVPSSRRPMMPLARAYAEQAFSRAAGAQLVEGNVLVTDAEPGIELLTGTTGVIRDNDVFGDLATIAAAIVADGCALFRNEYVEVGNESNARIGTASVDD